MDQHSQDDRRSHYRLEYPEAERPTVRIGSRGYEVSEISEGGAQILISSNEAGSLARSFTGVLTFKDGEVVPIAGDVIRATVTRLIVKLSKGVTLKQMLSEQIRLRKKYPMLYGGGSESSDANPT